MNIQPLTLTHQTAWADLLATTFDRRADDMERLLVFLNQWYPLIAFGAWDGERLVGQYSCLLRDLYVPETGRVIKIGMSMNMAVHPDYRGRGLIKKMAAPVYDTIRECGGEAGVGFSTQAGVQVDRHSREYGYQVVGQMQSYGVLLHRHFRETPAALTEQFPNHAIPCVENRAYLHFADDLAAIRHRFTKHPFRTYQFGISDAGIVIFRDLKIGIMRGVSLLAVYGSDHAAALRSFAAALRRENIYFLHTLISPALLPMLQTMGLCLRAPYTRNPYYLTARSLNGALSDRFMDFNDWACIGGQII